MKTEPINPRDLDELESSLRPLFEQTALHASSSQVTSLSRFASSMADRHEGHGIRRWWLWSLAGVAVVTAMVVLLLPLFHTPRPAHSVGSVASRHSVEESDILAMAETQPSNEALWLESGDSEEWAFWGLVEDSEFLDGLHAPGSDEETVLLVSAYEGLLGDSL